MLGTILICAALLGSPTSTQAPDAERVKAVVAELKSAFDEPEAEARLAAIEKSIGTVDPAVIQVLEKGLRDKDVRVRSAVVGALRDMRHPASLKALHGEFTRCKKDARGVDHTISVVKAIAAHGSTDSIELLCEDGIAQGDAKVLAARVLALGNIRSDRSVEALVGMMRLAGPQRVQPFMDELRLALLVLTGSDQGRSQELWMRWWNENKKDVHVLGEMPQLTKEDAKRWYGFLDQRPMQERQKKRGERGQDPEGK